MIKLTNNIIINKYNKKNSNFILTWGGQPSEKYGCDFMKIQFEKSKIKNKNIIFSNWEIDLEKITAVLRKKEPYAQITSIVGFSKGGSKAWNEVHKEHYKLIALLDPTSWDEDLEKAKKASKNTILLYNLKSFGYKNAHSKRMCDLAQILGEQRSHKIDVEHLDQPTYFFKKYEDLL